MKELYKFVLQNKATMLKYNSNQDQPNSLIDFLIACE